jgi:carboxylesterase type B
MHAAWVAFATTGDPGWPQYDTASRAVMTFDQPASRVIENPRADEYALWGRIG